jgi:hypothetical protein
MTIARLRTFFANYSVIVSIASSTSSRNSSRFMNAPLASPWRAADGYQLSADGYQPSADGYQLSADGYQLSAFGCAQQSHPPQSCG